MTDIPSTNERSVHHRSLHQTLAIGPSVPFYPSLCLFFPALYYRVSIFHFPTSTQQSSTFSSELKHQRAPTGKAYTSLYGPAVSGRRSWDANDISGRRYRRLDAETEDLTPSRGSRRRSQRWETLSATVSPVPLDQHQESSTHGGGSAEYLEIASVRFPLLDDHRSVR